MRHHARLAREQVEKPIVNLDTINRRQPKARKIGNEFQYPFDQ
jgi:hypothetical protein